MIGLSMKFEELMMEIQTVCMDSDIDARVVISGLYAAVDVVGGLAHEVVADHLFDDLGVPDNRGGAEVVDLVTAAVLVKVVRERVFVE